MSIQNLIKPPDLKELLDRKREKWFADLNCVSVGKIESFSTADQTATISISYLKQKQNTGDFVSYPVILKCPCVVMNGGGAYVSFPITTGDECLVLFCDREIDTWLETGGVNQPRSSRTHDLTDAVALVGIKSLPNSITSYYNGFQIFYKSSKINIDASGNVTVNSAAKVDVIATGNVSVDAGGDVSVSADGDVSVTAGDDVSVTATGDITISGATVSLNP